MITQFEIIIDGKPVEIIELPEFMIEDKSQEQLLKRAQVFAFHRHKRMWEGEGMLVREWHGEDAF